jgi:hypothetical protein
VEDRFRVRSVADFVDGDAERSALAFAKHQVPDADADCLADAVALAVPVYFRRYSH